MLEVDVLFRDILNDPAVASDNYAVFSKVMREAKMIALNHATKEQNYQRSYKNRKVKLSAGREEIIVSDCWGERGVPTN
ncbi:hypothetical protein COCON_G00149140 [Conger conger]|uniref:Uncharacterized protein n=1 Tax=Conger conger TaxID=82655 RepID=A0A9Q1DCU1_CONCO|nr:hypothetical protein COCON_G00149140 [Conger conger]